MILNILIVGIELFPAVGIGKAITIRSFMTVDELVGSTILDIHIEVGRTTIEDMVALEVDGRRFVVLVVHKRTCLDERVDIERFQVAHILEGIVGDAVSKLLMDGQRLEGLGGREETLARLIIESAVHHRSTTATLG